MKTAKELFESGAMLHRSWDQHEQYLMNKGTFIELFERFASQDKWISVEEKPLKPCEVLICLDNGNVDVAQFDGKIFTGWFIETDQIIFWQPLPKAPNKTT